jgi:hypothetical protein
VREGIRRNRAYVIKESKKIIFKFCEEKQKRDNIELFLIAAKEREGECE